MINKEETIKKLREFGLKVTPQRAAIIDYLDGNKCHPTAEDIFAALGGDYPTLSLATVYNTLESLITIGEVSEINLDPERKHFDPDTTDHNHIVCTECNKITDVFADYSSGLLLPKEILSDFEVSSVSVHFSGICTDCR